MLRERIRYNQHTFGLWKYHGQYGDKGQFSVWLAQHDARWTPIVWAVTCCRNARPSRDELGYTSLGFLAEEVGFKI